ncbi:uncharacterized protein LOC117650910 [Thrips palmi]|uniref:Uncharacterized protein LOC117650910 n=1 Tax=Thrips palmi TaxID=161013 RepID=A0A6P8ZYE6_THRPL|nr:uncharacterized protein LOC117650910 [Thrips palmi]XP_034250443.1 uncharacterized protein LOC117650910 [Thrips palmi]
MKSVAVTCVSVLLAVGAIMVPGASGGCGGHDPALTVATKTGLSGSKSTECFKDKLGTCFGRFPKMFAAAASSMYWNYSNKTIVVYDGHLCGGYSQAFRWPVPYKQVQLDGSTKDVIYDNGGLIDDLSRVCKFDTCGYSSTVSTKQFRGDCVPDALGPYADSPVNRSPKSGEKCTCLETWDKSIRSVRFLENDN